jgi:hypothetical protein
MLLPACRSRSIAAGGVARTRLMPMARRDAHGDANAGGGPGGNENWLVLCCGLLKTGIARQ